jgi:hypothetical protein
MRAQAQVLNADDIEFAITFTATLADWKRLSKLIPSDHPGWKVNAAIHDVVRLAEQRFHLVVEGEE